MAKTAQMKLVELMILKDDIAQVIEYLGKKGCFQFQTSLGENSPHANGSSSYETNPAKEIFEKLQGIRTFLGIKDVDSFTDKSAIPTDVDFAIAGKIITAIDEMKEKELAALDTKKRLDSAYTEALAFANLKVPYSELDHLSFLNLRIGKIDPSVIEELKFNVGNRGVIIPLGEDKTRILAASSKKARFAMDTELKRFGFVALEIPENFNGIPDDVLEGLKVQTEEAKKAYDHLEEERMNYAETHESEILRLLMNFSIGMQVSEVKDKLEATQLVYRITGWIPAMESETIMKELDNLTEGRIAIRQYQPEEVPSVKSGHEKVPVKLKHGKLISSFEGIIFSYGAPLYGTIDPTPIVAIFFTLLFGIMFGDAGQGLVFVLIGVLMLLGVIKKFPVSPKYGPVFVAIGTSSTIMGILTGEFFANEEILKPVTRFLRSIFGQASDAPILHLMPSGSAIDKLFYFFLFTLGVGFIINSVGLIINIVNNFSLKHPGKALFGKTGLCGACFFWYVVFMAIRIVVFKSSIHVYDWVIMGITLLGVFLAHPLERIVENEHPICENGLLASVIEGIVEILEVVSSYLSNSVSFLRVGAFALAHAVLGYIIFSLMEMIQGGGSIGGVFGSLAVSIIGNAVVIVLEGMIVAIQVMRLQYYEFFSKFFTETGKEFKPFKFIYKA